MKLLVTGAGGFIGSYRILSSNHDRPYKTLLFCCSNLGEENSTVLIDFALRVASGGDRVLLVDVNMRTLSLHQVFRLLAEDGLAELLLEKGI
jgi:Mrp family chromosome partitioning ATPase